MFGRWWGALRASHIVEDAPSPPWFLPALIVVTAAGLVIRVGFAISIWSRELSGDAQFFHGAAANIANGKGYSQVYGALPHLGLQPTAAHPPVFPLVLSILDVLGLRSVGTQRIIVAVLASSGVLLVGLLGRKVAGATVGVAAAGIASVDPLWFQPSGILMSESLYLVAIPGLLLVAIGCAEKPGRPMRLALLGVLIGVATLIRSEAILLFLFLALPLAVLAQRTWRGRWLSAGALVIGLALVMGPWLIRNDLQLGGFVLADDGGGTLAGSYCAGTLDPNAPQYGSFDLGCALGETGFYVLYKKPPNGTTHWTERTLNNALTTQAIRFAGDHVADLPGAVVARELSVWGFPNETWARGLSAGEGRVYGYELAGQILYWVELPFVIVGALALARRSWPFFVIVMPIAVVAVNAALFYGSTRMRVAAEPSLAVLAAAGCVALITVVRARRPQGPNVSRGSSRATIASRRTLEQSSSGG